MTTLNITLSPTLVGPISPTNPNPQYLQPGVWVDAVYFTYSGATSTANWTQLVANGVAQAGTSITLPDVYNGGKVYVLVWSGASTTTDPFQGTVASPGFITQESDISIGSAETNNYRFDSIELTLNGGGTAAINDVANLTSVVGFGLPMQLSSSNGSVGYNVSGSTIFSSIQSILPTGPSGFYAPVMLSQNGDVFVIGHANSDGREHIRLLGENSFGIEDLTAGRGSDFDYNDILIGLHLQSSPA